jgi:uncharacterized protein (TIGR03437 family)
MPATAQVELTPLACGEEARLRAAAEAKAATVEFVNASQERLDVYRLDGEGKRVFEFKLEAESRVARSTFVAQPWVVTDVDGACRGIYLPVTEASIVRIAPLSIVLPKTGIIFNAVEGGPPPAPQTFGIVNGGMGTMEWSLSLPMMTGFMVRGWVSLSPLVGKSEAGKPPAMVEVTVDPWRLDPGEYCNLVEVTAKGAVNSPLNFCVIMVVHPAGTDLGPQVETAGLLFAGAPGGESPGAEIVRVTNANATAMPLGVSIEYTDGEGWLSVAADRELIGPGETAKVTVQPGLTGLAPGLHAAALRLRFTEGGPEAKVQVSAFVPGSAAPAARWKGRSAEGEPCAATRLLPVFTLLGPNFRTQAGWPVPVEVLVADDCGQPMTYGQVTATFSNNDPPVHLAPVTGARWSGTWPARNVQPTGMKITVKAQQPERGIEGVAAIEGGVHEPTDIPFVPAGGVVSAASLEASPVAPGSFVAIRGERLSEGEETASRLPLLPKLQGTEVFVAGRTIPLFSTSQGEVKAFVPYGVAVNGRHQMILRRGHCMSVPLPLEAAAAQPAVFTVDGTGKGQGRIFVVGAENQQVLAGPESPAKAGDTVIIYAAGLGKVDAALEVGEEVPESVQACTVNPVTVTFGGVEARVSFAGLLPGVAGLYQVVATVPEGVTPGDKVPVVLTTGGRSSPPVTVALR